MFPVEEIPRKLVTAAAEGRLVPFVGSGVSSGVGCGLPSWSDLLLALGAHTCGQGGENAERAGSLVETFVRMERYAEAAEEALRALGKHEFRAKIAELFDIPIYGNPSVPLALWALQPKLILTTNYDRVLEATNLGAKSITNDHEDVLTDLERVHQPVVWHLHGWVERLDLIALAPSQYVSLYGGKDTPPSLALASLREVLSRRTLLFVGFGFNDIEVLGAIKGVLDLFGGALPASFAVLDDHDKLRLERADLRTQYNVNVIRVSNYAEALVDFLARLRLRSIEILEEKAVLNALAQFNRRAALQLGARHVSTHLRSEKSRPALVAPGRTSCGCKYEQPLVAPLIDAGRFTVRLFQELLPQLDAGSRAAVFGQEAILAGRTGGHGPTVYGEPLKSVVAGLIECGGKAIGIVKVENNVADVNEPFGHSDTEMLINLINEFGPHLQQAYKWIQKREWTEIRLAFPHE